MHLHHQNENALTPESQESICLLVKKPSVTLTTQQKPNHPGTEKIPARLYTDTAQVTIQQPTYCIHWEIYKDTWMFQSLYHQNLSILIFFSPPVLISAIIGCLQQTANPSAVHRGNRESIYASSSMTFVLLQKAYEVPHHSFFFGLDSWK